MNNLIRPLVLVHGLWNTPILFDRLRQRLNQPHSLLFIPYLPHECGRISLNKLAIELDVQITETFGLDTPIDLLGFSMGGLIGRIWLQELNGFKRTRRFYSVGSPHNGTLTAQLVPSSLFNGIADMKLGSKLIKSLKKSSNNLQEISCRSYFCSWDLMSFPGFQSVLPVGTTTSVPVLTHKGLIKSPISLELISSDLFAVSDKPTMSN